MGLKDRRERRVQHRALPAATQAPEHRKAPWGSPASNPEGGGSRCNRRGCS